MARLVVSAAVGVAVGYFLGPQAGFTAFSLAYGATGFLDPRQKVQGPRLDDLKAPAATYGSPIAYIEGAPRGAWNIAWASDKREISTTQSQGKGGPGVDSTTFTYEMDLLYLVSINELAAVRRIWSNGKLIWSNGDDADAETLAASSATSAWRDIRFYSGAADQLPDPTYEAAVGIGNAPAYRGRGTIFIEGLNLGGSGQMPVLTFEVLSEATQTFNVNEFTHVNATADGAVPFTAGIPAVSLTGFDMLIGINYDIANGKFNQYRVWHIDSTGAATDGGIFDLPDFRGPCATGNSDESCIIAQELPSFLGPVTYYTISFADGATFQIDSDGDHVKKTFSKLGEAIVSVAATGVTDSDQKVRLYTREGVFVERSSPLALATQSIATDGTFIYCLSDDGTTVYQLDLATLTLQQTVTTPTTATESTIVCSPSGDLYLNAIGGISHPNSLWQWAGGSSWNLIAENLSHLYSNPVTGSSSGFANGVFFTQIFDSSGSPPYFERIYYAKSQEAIVTPGLDQVVRRLCLRTGQLTDADIDVTDLASDIVRAMAITQATTTRVAIETLMSAYLFEAVEGETLRFVKRGGASVLSIPYTDLAAGSDGTAEPLPLNRQNDPEIAARVSVKFANVLNDFQDGLVQADRLVTESTAEQVVEVPLGFTPTEAAKLADANTMDLAVSLIQIGPISLPRKYSALEPTDVVTLNDANGDTFRARIGKGTIGQGIIQIELVLDDASVVDSVAATDSNYSSSTLVRLLTDTTLVPMDIAPLSDAFAGPGYMAAFGSGGIWPGAELDKSADDVSYTKLLDVSDRAVMGTASTTLATFTGGNVFDETNTLTVDVGSGELSSSTRDALISGNVNALAVGSNAVGWEVIQFRTASLVTAGVYLLSGLLRGRRGTEWMIPLHVASEKVVLLQTAGLRHVDDTQADVGVPYHLKAVTHGKSRADASSQVFTDTGVAQKPFAVVDLRAVDAGGLTEITWHRRSRLSSRFLATMDPPLGETVESYDVELYDASDVLRDSQTLSAPIYTATGLQGGDYILPPVWGMQVISGTRVAIRQDLPQQVFSSPAFSAESILALNSDGTVAEQSATLENIVTGWTFHGSAVYVVGYRVTNSLPALYNDSLVQRLTVGTLASIDATNTAGTAGDYFGIAHDGTDVWVSEHISGNLRRLNTTTLVSIASYAVSGNPGAMQYSGGSLYVVCPGSGELVCFDSTAHSETYRVSVVASPFDVLLVGSVLFVLGGSQVGVYAASDGSLLATHSFQPMVYLPQRAVVAFGSQVVVIGTDIVGGNGVCVLFLNATTGARESLLQKPVFDLAYAAGAVSTDLYLTGSPASGSSYRTRKYEVAPPNLSGYSLKVWQNGAVGRGYPATLEL